jgi:hypothetical protein
MRREEGFRDSLEGAAIFWPAEPVAFIRRPQRASTIPISSR